MRVHECVYAVRGRRKREERERESVEMREKTLDERVKEDIRSCSMARGYLPTNVSLSCVWMPLSVLFYRCVYICALRVLTFRRMDGGSYARARKHAPRVRTMTYIC